MGCLLVIGAMLLATIRDLDRCMMRHGNNPCITCVIVRDVLVLHIVYDRPSSGALKGDVLQLGAHSH